VTHKVSRGELNSKPHGTSFSRHLPIELPPRGPFKKIFKKTLNILKKLKQQT